jgi:hypothetical protein
MKMTTEEIIQGNKLIAEFMGGIIQPNNTVCPYPRGLPSWANILYDFDTMRIGGYEYHTSWDWLMPVVEKIESEGFTVNIQDRGCCIYKKFSHPICTAERWETKIEGIWQAVTSFIKWYNTQK